MSRTTAFWFGATDDAKAPPRVHIRVFLRYDGRCACGCNRKISPGEHWQLDHIVAIVNGGSNSEGNLQPLLVEHHKSKTRTDVADKSATYAKRIKHHGLRKAKHPMPGSRASGWRKRMDGRVERRT